MSSNYAATQSATDQKQRLFELIYHGAGATKDAEASAAYEEELIAHNTSTKH